MKRAHILYLCDGRVARVVDDNERETFRWMRELKGYGPIVETDCPVCRGHGETTVVDDNDADEETCPDCDGDGEVECTCSRGSTHEHTCDRCKGAGFLSRENDPDPEVTDCEACDGVGVVLVEPGADVERAHRTGARKSRAA